MSTSLSNIKNNQTQRTYSPKVSIILPVYNAGEYLRSCLDSLVNQTLREIEIICVLDCPTDGSDKVVEEYAYRDNRFVVIRNEKNLHISESRNIGIRAATGEYIGFSDHDDTCDLDRYERLYSATDDGKKKIVITAPFSDEITNPMDKSMNSYYPYCIRALHVLLNNERRARIGHVTPNIYKKKFIETNSLFFVDTRKCFAEDLIFNLRFIHLITNDDDIALLHKDYYHYSSHNEMTSRQYFYMDDNHIITFANEIRKFLPSTTINNNELNLFVIRYLYTSFRRCIKEYGFLTTIKRYKKSIGENMLVKDMIQETMLSNISDFSLPKKAFLMLFKILV